jgi:8-oxo-dGTP pyrophosphatase MutT (NUDIX family)
VTARPMREAARVIVVDEEDRVLLVRFDLFRGGHGWATGGGGLERGETHVRTPGFEPVRLMRGSS